MNISQEFFIKLASEVDAATIFLLENVDSSNDINLDCLQSIENVETMLNVLKFKLVLIYKNKSCNVDFDFKNLLDKAINKSNISHDVILYSLLIQKSDNALKQTFRSAYEFLNNDFNEKNNSAIKLQLDILSAVFEVCIITKNDYAKNIDDLKPIQNLIFKLLRSYDEKELRKIIIKDVIPKYIRCTENDTFFTTLWQEFQTDILTDEYLLILEEYFIPQTCDEKQFTILDKTEFWLKMQANILSNNSGLKKYSTYLLKRAIQSQFINKRYINHFSASSNHLNLIYWDKENCELYKTAWRNFFILCDISNEKQLHLIEPSFKLYTTLEPLHNTWKTCITKLFISHPHFAVVRQTIKHVLSSQWACEIETLIDGLNNNFLYDNSNEFSINNDLTTYVSNLTQENFKIFVDKMCLAQPSPIPFYFICQSFESIDSSKLDLTILSNLINSSEKVPHSYIRMGILDSIFLCFMRNLNENECKNISNEIKKLIYLFNKKHNFWVWNRIKFQIIKWACTKSELFRLDLHNLVPNMFTDNPQILPKEYLVIIPLLLEADILDENWAKDLLNNLISFVKHNGSNPVNLNYLLLFCRIAESISYSNISVDIWNEIFMICENEDVAQYTTEFFDQIESILVTIISLYIDFNINFRGPFSTFLEKLITAKKYTCYLIFSKHMMKFIDTSCFYDEDLLIELLENLKEIKTKYENELAGIPNENALKRKIISDYYHTKLNSRKKLFTIQLLGIPEKDYSIVLQKINKYYDKGGPDILISVIDFLQTILVKLCFKTKNADFNIEFIKLLERCQKDIFNLRTNEQFKPAISKFISCVFHEEMCTDEFLKDFTANFCKEMFNANQILPGIRNQILSELNDRMQTGTFDILVDALLYGPILRKDQRIEFDTCSLISKKNETLKNPCLDRQVRSKAIIICLSTSNLKPDYNDIFIKLITKYEAFAGKRYFGDSQIHLTKLRIMQTLHIILSEINNANLNMLPVWLFTCLTNESQQPSIKILLQWLLVRVYDLLNCKESAVIDLVARSKDLKGTTCTSIFPILYHLIKDGQVDMNVVNTCMEFLFLYTMGQHFNIRYYAQMSIKYIFEAYKSNAEFRTKYLSIYKTVCNVIDQTSSEKTFDVILPFKNLPLTLQTIYYDIPRLTHVTHIEWIPTSEFEYFGGGPLKIPITAEETLADICPPIKKPVVASIDNSDNMNIQKKIDPLSTAIIRDEEEVKQPSGNLIVVASLIDRAPNLGGLSRTCEVFGVKQYALNNLQFVKSKEYQSLSMSSEKWVDTIEVKLDDLPNYLVEMKKKGYMVVGAEQTAESKCLDHFHFDENTVLLLGNEKEGIPPNLIHLLDECIEIPQFGQIRSLNVHVAGALFIWEYTKQYCTNKH